MTKILSAQPLLIKRIKTQIPDFKTVGSPSVIMKHANEIISLLPACIVHPKMPVFDKKEDARKGSERAMQFYTVDIYVPFIAGEFEETATEVLAGDFIEQLIETLRDYQVSGYSRIKIETASNQSDAEIIYADGFAIFTLILSHYFTV